MAVLAPQHTQEEVYQRLHRQAKKLNVEVTLFSDSARQEKEWLYLPVHVDCTTSAYERASKLQDLEDSWNGQEPRPEPQIFLLPAAQKQSGNECER